MSKKILKIGGILAAPFTGGASLALTAGASLLPGKKKKPAETAASATAKKGPIITPLGRSAPLPGAGTILSDRLGG